MKTDGSGQALRMSPNRPERSPGTISAEQPHVSPFRQRLRTCRNFGAATIGLRTSTKYEFSLAKPQGRVNNAGCIRGCFWQLLASGSRDNEVTAQAQYDSADVFPWGALNALIIQSVPWEKFAPCS